MTVRRELGKRRVSARLGRAGVDISRVAMSTPRRIRRGRFVDATEVHGVTDK
jgi:hypothetical protein